MPFVLHLTAFFFLVSNGVSMACTTENKEKKKQNFVQLQLMNRVQLVLYLILFDVCFLFKWHFGQKSALLWRRKKTAFPVCWISIFSIAGNLHQVLFFGWIRKIIPQFRYDFQPSPLIFKEKCLRNKYGFWQWHFWLNSFGNGDKVNGNWAYFRAITFWILLSNKRLT